MFQLLVKYGKWNENQDEMLMSRVFEHTNNDLIERFRVNGYLDFTKIVNIPVLFMSEISRSDNYNAKVGYISRLIPFGKKYQIEYSFDSSIPEFSITEIQEMAQELNIDSWEFARTHWAFKDIDLFRVFLKRYLLSAPKPKTFNIPNKGIDNSLISVMMPFDKKYDPVFEVIKNIDPLGLNILRADNIWEDSVVINDVVSLIWRARIVICDCTERNPNVFYEAGIAHALGKEVILITQSKNDIPFDLQHIRYLVYLNNNEGLNKLRTDLIDRIRNLLK